MRGAVLGALSRPRSPGPARPGPAQACVYSDPPVEAGQVGPARSGWRCSRAPRCACACGSASDSSTASAVSSPPVPECATGREREHSPGASGGTSLMGYGRGTGQPQAWDTRGDGAGNQGYRHRTEHGGSGPGRPGWGKAVWGLQPGQGPGSGCTAAQGECRGSRPRSSLWFICLGAGPSRLAFSFWILRFLTRSPAEFGPSNPRAPPKSSQGDGAAIAARQRTWVRTSRHLPSALEVGPAEGARGRLPPSSGQGLRG